MAESKEHKELKERAYYYLWDKGYRIAKKEKGAGYYGIYDAWGIRPRDYYTMGIEVKVSRADFKSSHIYKNNKLENDYGGGAEENYYLCPAGLIKPEETGVYGLLWFDGERLRNKKKPKFIHEGLKGKLDRVIDFLEHRYN